MKGVLLTTLSLVFLSAGCSSVIEGPASPEPVPVEPSSVMRGMYSFMADAAIFIECQTGRKLPVALESDNLALERAYLKVRQQPGEALLVMLEGQVVERMPMEGPGPVPTLLPVKFLGIWAGESCEMPSQ